MSKPRPIQFRAIHTKNRWRRANHETEKHALVGSSSTDRRSARALFDKQNEKIDYRNEGEARFVIVWDPSANTGTIVKPDSSNSDGLCRADIPMGDIVRFESEGPPSDAELDRYFFRGELSILRADFSDIDSVLEDFNQRLAVSLQSSAAARKRRLAHADPVPPKIEVRTNVFVRNSDVVAEVLERAAGVCEGCGNDAPFIRASDGTPYLEVHHRIHLASGGPDTVTNAIALCPNCHRLRHFGKWVE